jgi:hypothetical protein
VQSRSSRGTAVRAYSRRAWHVAISPGGLWRPQQPNGVWPSGSRHGQPSMAPGGNGGPPNGISGSCLGRWQPEHDEDAGRLEIGRRRAKNLVGLRRRTRVPLRPDHLQARPRPAGRRRGDTGGHARGLRARSQDTVVVNEPKESNQPDRPRVHP